MEEQEIIAALDSLGEARKFAFIRKYLFHKANGYAPDLKALCLRQACNLLIPVINELDPTYFKESKL